MDNHHNKHTYDGPETIVVAMDIGTTHSAVSFAHFLSGKWPQPGMVAHWPGQLHRNGAAKVPTLVSYKDGTANGYGMDAERNFEEHPENVARWFKLHLHPPTMKVSNAQTFEIPSLPVEVTIERVYVDILRYLMENTQRFYETFTPGGEEIWARLRATAVIVLAIPNGWSFKEQEVLRRAAIKASLVTEEGARRLLRFVTEAEASVHYALANQRVDWLKRGGMFAVIDCGGFTVDTTVYRCATLNPLSLKETCPSECVQEAFTLTGK